MSRGLGDVVRCIFEADQMRSLVLFQIRTWNGEDPRLALEEAYRSRSLIVPSMARSRSAMSEASRAVARETLYEPRLGGWYFGSLVMAFCLTGFRWSGSRVMVST